MTGFDEEASKSSKTPFQTTAFAIDPPIITLCSRTQITLQCLMPL